MICWRWRKADPYLLVVLLLPLACGLVRAQHVGVGAQIGNLSGLTVRLFKADTLHVQQEKVPLEHRPMAMEWLFEWSLRNSYTLHTNFLHSQRIPGSALTLDIGFGLITRLETEQGSRRFIPGISQQTGVHFFRSRYEVFLRAVPHVRIEPAFKLFMGGGMGIRYIL